MLGIYLGLCDDINYWNKKITWKPNKEQNPHMIISGGSGSGKTETLKVICHELYRNGITLLIFDFHDDFLEFGDRIINEESVRIHPLHILKGERPKDVVYKVSEIIKHTFENITVVQEGKIREAIRQFYKDSGITNLSTPFSGNKKLLPFSYFYDCIDSVCTDQRTLSSLHVKLDILFDYDLFSAKDEMIDFDSLLSSSTVFQLKNAPSDDVKMTVTDLMINKLIQYSYHLEQSKRIRLYCIIDEAHRLAYPGSPIDKLFREARKYGIGIILASQRASDFNEVLLSNAGTVLTFKQNLAKDARYIARNKWAKEEVLLNAQTGEGFVKFSTEKRALPVQIVPLKNRSHGRSSKKTK